MEKIRLGYFADGPWSHQAFELLIKDRNIKIAFICVRFDTKDEVLKGFCEDHKIPYLKHANVNDSEFLDILSTFNCDLFVSMSFNQILRKNLLSLAPRGVINCHAGKLPFYRGRNILNWALINGETEFGITVHYVDEGIDTGDIILQETFPITLQDNYATLLEAAYVECANVLYKAINMFVTNDNVIGKPQNEIHPVGMYCSARRAGDEIIDWQQSSEKIFNFVRAICSPGPNARTYLNEHEIEIESVQLIPHAPEYIGIPGSVVGIDNEGFVVKTLDTSVKVITYKSPVKITIGKRFFARPVEGV